MILADCLNVFMKALFKVPVIDGRTYSREGAGVEYKHAQSQWVIGVRALTPDGWGGVGGRCTRR